MADKRFNVLRSVVAHTYLWGDKYEMLDFVDELESKTQYDVDAVVIELEELRGVVFDEYTKFCFDKAIDVVKRGGRNE